VVVIIMTHRLGRGVQHEQLMIILHMALYYIRLWQQWLSRREKNA